MLHDTHSGRDKRDGRRDEMGTGPAEIRLYAGQVLRQGQVHEQFTEIGGLQLEGAPKTDDRLCPFDFRVKRKDEQEQEDAKGIAEVGGGGKELAIGQQDKRTDDAGEDEKKQLPAIVCLQGDKALHHVVSVVVGGSEDAGDADGAQDEPDPDE